MRNLLERMTILLAIALAMGSSCFASEGIRRGDEAPIAVGRNIDNQPVLLSSYLGKVVVVSFWASWCPPCRKEFPVLNSLQVAAGEDRLAVIAINTEKWDVFRRATRLLEPLKLQLLMTNDVDGSSSLAYGQKVLPFMIIVGKDGRVVRIRKGYNDGELESLLADVNNALSAP